MFTVRLSLFGLMIGGFALQAAPIPLRVSEEALRHPEMRKAIERLKQDQPSLTVSAGFPPSVQKALEELRLDRISKQLKMLEQSYYLLDFAAVSYELPSIIRTLEGLPSIRNSLRNRLLARAYFLYGANSRAKGDLVTAREFLSYFKEYEYESDVDLSEHPPALESMILSLTPTRPPHRLFKTADPVPLITTREEVAVLKSSFPRLTQGGCELMAFLVEKPKASSVEIARVSSGSVAFAAADSLTPPWLEPCTIRPATTRNRTPTAVAVKPSAPLQPMPVSAPEPVVAKTKRPFWKSPWMIPIIGGLAAGAIIGIVVHSELSESPTIVVTVPNRQR